MNQCRVEKYSPDLSSVELYSSSIILFSSSLVLYVMATAFTFFSLLSDSISGDRFGRYFLYSLTNFMTTYGRGDYEDAAVWSRRLAEVYCNYVFYHFDPTMLAQWYGLAELVWELPEWVWQYGAFAHARAVGMFDAGFLIGAPLSMSTVFDDLDALRRYGNRGAHADRQFDVGVVLPDSGICCRILRVSLSFMSLHARLRSRM